MPDVLPGNPPVSVTTLEELNAALRSAEQPQPGHGGIVTGEGPVGAALAFVGEQPGDEEDRTGRPFIGPAGQLLDRALAEADIERERTYVTNAVKWFKFVQRGKRRLHQKPDGGDIQHFRWWLWKELDLARRA